MSDTLTDGRRCRVLCVVDDFTRECLALVADTSLSGKRVVRELDAIAAERGYPATVVSDNGTELTSSAVLAWTGGKLGLRSRVTYLKNSAPQHFQAQIEQVGESAHPCASNE